jgi:hypothetical protein
VAAPIRWVLVRDPTGVRDAQAFLCTNLDATPMEILGWFVSRWSIETTFQESRAHLGVETQRQWSDLAIARTTPALFGMFSLIALWAALDLNVKYSDYWRWSKDPSHPVWKNRALPGPDISSYSPKPAASQLNSRSVHFFDGRSRMIEDFDPLRAELAFRNLANAAPLGGCPSNFAKLPVLLRL